MLQCSLVTGSEGMYNITAEIKKQVEKQNWKDGFLLIYCPHTTWM